jgi:2-oxo-4-hydroxy-4-carboxy-5-ureidoimidazoline decarboxylase
MTPEPAPEPAPESTPALDAPEPVLRSTLTACLAVPRWVESVLARRPYDSLDALSAAAYAAASPLTGAEIDQAMAHHPRIGERPQGDGLASQLSRNEQRSSASDDDDLAAQLAAGNQAYEEKFERVFLIRAAGRSRPEILAELHRRLALEPAPEQTIVGEELRDIALIRLRQLFAESPSRREPKESS